MFKMIRKDRMSVQWMKDYVDGCVKDVSNDVMSMAVNDMQIVINKYCNSAKLSKLFISWHKCGNSALNGTVQCWQRYVLDMERVYLSNNEIKDQDKLGLICWSVVSLISKLKNN